MKRTLLTVLPTLGLAIGILSFSVLQASAIEYDFLDSSNKVLPTPFVPKINYELPDSSIIKPDSVFWPLKAGIDKTWLVIETEPQYEAEQLLYYADERLVYSLDLFKQGKSDLGLSVLTKAEKYLEEAFVAQQIAQAEGKDTTLVLQKISMSSLKHSEVIDYIVTICPEEVQAFVVKTSDYSKRLYNETKTQFYAQGITPFE